MTIDQSLSTLWPIAFAVQADSGEARIDTFRASVQLKMEGRRLALRLARMLGMRGVRCDVFGTGEVITDDPWRDPFVYPTFTEWRREY